MTMKTHVANWGGIAGTRTAPPPPPPPEATITLRMPLVVAETLLGTLVRIGGPLEGRRGHAHDLVRVLYDLDVKSPPEDDFRGREGRSESIYFTDTITRP